MGLVDRAILVVVGIVGAIAWQPFQKEMARRALKTGPNGPKSPESVGVPFERVSIESSGQKLDGYLVRADAKCGAAAAILIFHGLGETISRWVNAQRVLYQSCVSSLVFDYTGTGDSTGDASFEAANSDMVATYRFASERFAPARLYVLGHSMGNAPMLAAVPTLSPTPDGVVVGNAFSTMRASMERSSFKWMAWLAPELRHNALHRDATGAWWRPVVQFVGAPGPMQAATP